MDISFCALFLVLALMLITSIPLSILFKPYFKKFYKYIFTDRPMTLGSLLSIALLALVIISGRVAVDNVRLVSCGAQSVAKAPQIIQIASICTCGCGRHK